jgi:hypothetical protein
MAQEEVKDDTKEPELTIEVVKRECKLHGIHSSWLQLFWDDGGKTPHFCMKCIVDVFFINNAAIARNYDVPN